jgi:PDDEXK-like domain of unknown function (DUF3799)
MAVIKDMEFEEYCKLDGINQSLLVKYNQRPDMVTVVEEESPALLFGSQFHTYLLEPDKFNKDIVIIPSDIKVRRGSAWEAFSAKHIGKILLHQSEYDKQTEQMQNMVVSLNSGKYETARKLIERCKHRELSVTWRNQRHDCDCKARLDLFDEEYGIIADVKTTITAVPEEWLRKELYSGRAPHFQPAWYLDVVQSEIDNGVITFLWILFEKEAPYGISVVKASPAELGDGDMVELGKQQIDKILPKYLADKQENYFAGLPDTIVNGRLPDWYFNQNFEIPIE